MKALSGIADALDQVCLHEGMDILVFFGKFQLSSLDILQDALQAVNDGLLGPLLETMPCFASIVTWAMLPWIS